MSAGGRLPTRQTAAPGEPLPTEPDPWRVLARRTPFQNDWMRIEDHDVVRPDGQPGRYGVVRFVRHAVGVLPVHPDGTVTLVGQHRFPLGRYSWEAPEGGVEPGEDREVAARRELAEEAGLSAGVLTPIMAVDVSNSLTDETATLYLAHQLSPVRAAPDVDEALAITRLPFMNALERAVAGEIRDSLTLVMLLRAYHMAKTGALPTDLARAMLG